MRVNLFCMVCVSVGFVSVLVAGLCVVICLLVLFCFVSCCFVGSVSAGLAVYFFVLVGFAACLSIDRCFVAVLVYVCLLVCCWLVAR